MKTSTVVGLAAIGAAVYYLTKKAGGESTTIPLLPADSAPTSPEMVAAQPYYVITQAPTTKELVTRKISTIQEGVDFINDFTSSGNIPVMPFAKSKPTTIKVGGVKVPARVETFQEPGGKVRQSTVYVDVGRVTKTPQKAIDWMKKNNPKFR